MFGKKSVTFQNYLGSRLFTLSMTNKLVVIINSLKVPKIKKILLYEMKFLVPNYSCLQNPWLEGLPPPDPVVCVLCPQLNLLNSPEKKILGTPLIPPTRLQAIQRYVMLRYVTLRLLDNKAETKQRQVVFRSEALATAGSNTHGVTFRIPQRGVSEGSNSTVNRVRHG